MSKIDFKSGRQDGWTERDQYIIEHQQTYGRSMFGWPMMGIGGLIILWCGVIFSLSGTQAIAALTHILLLCVGIALCILGWHHNRSERRQQLSRIKDFEERWGIQRFSKHDGQSKLSHKSDTKTLDPAQ